MDLALSGKVAIVGGSSKGIGLATAQALAREGASVTLVARHGDELEGAASQIRESAGPQAALSELM